MWRSFSVHISPRFLIVGPKSVPDDTADIWLGDDRFLGNNDPVVKVSSPGAAEADWKSLFDEVVLRHLSTAVFDRGCNVEIHLLGKVRIQLMPRIGDDCDKSWSVSAHFQGNQEMINALLTLLEVALLRSSTPGTTDHVDAMDSNWHRPFNEVFCYSDIVCSEARGKWVAHIE